MGEENKRKGIRWWPAALILLAGAIALWIITRNPEAQRQDRLVGSAITVLSCATLLLVWAVFFSRMRWSVRLGIFLFVLLGLAAVASNLQIRGVTGDLVPIVEWRWKKRIPLATPALPAQENFSANTNAAQLTTLSFPQFMGPLRNGVLPEAQIDPHWKAYPPKLLWKQEVGAAWSGFVIQNHLAITQEQRGEQETVMCYDLLTGKPLWSHADTTKYSTTIAGEGPRATPTISSNRVYTFGATGILNCLELTTGRLIWTRNVQVEHNAKVPEWAYVSSPLLHEGRIYITAGGANNRSLVCHDAETGNFIWGAGEGGTQYSSAIFAELAGVPQIVIFQRNLWGCSLEGKPLWSHPWQGSQPRVSLPVLASTNQLLASSGYGVGAELLSFTADAQGNITPSRVWKSMSLKSKFGPIFLVDSHIYGLDDGIFTCVSLENGTRKWKEGRYGHGQGLLLGGHILMTTEAGEIVLIDPNPHELKEVAKLSVFSEKTWNPPAFAGEYLLLRNHLEAACLQLKTSGHPGALAKN